jgi:hypothetical protein
MSDDDYLMTEEEENLRDNINRELERLSFHLRISTLHANTHEAAFDYLQPINEWIKELSNVDSIITNMVKEWQQNQREKK